ncbi:MAG: hypothetical protein KTR14_08325 [Vampirovibrio sp.]|nr:hypothetical protein [Vampirovibrio sp.]
MTVAAVHTAAHTAAQATAKVTGPRVKQMFHNLGGHAQELFENYNYVRENALIIATVVMILSRWSVSSNSIRKAKNPEQKQHRTFEFYRMMMRDSLGMALTYLVLRASQRALTKRMNQYFGIATKRAPGFTKRIVGEVRDLLQGNSQQRVFQTYQGAPAPSSFENKKAYDWLKKKGILNVFAKEKDKAGNIRSEQQRLKKFIYWSSFWVSTIPTVYVSGSVVERFNRKHGEAFINWMTGDEHHKAPDHPEFHLRHTFQRQPAAPTLPGSLSIQMTLPNPPNQMFPGYQFPGATPLDTLKNQQVQASRNYPNAFSSVRQPQQQQWI